MNEFAPIALFVFKRPEHTRRALEALASNRMFASSPLYVFCDGARCIDEADKVEQTRQVVRAVQHPNKIIYEAAQNRGLAESIVDGVSRICEMHGRVIVVEDDLVVSPVFLDFLNHALHRYADDDRVMQVSGHNFPVDISDPQGALFLRMTTSWGWATWNRAWQKRSNDVDHARAVTRNYFCRHAFDLDGAYPFSRMLVDQMRGKNNSWAVWWYLSVYQAGGLVLFPKRSLVMNGGFDGSGTHCGNDHQSYSMQPSSENIDYFPDEIRESIAGRASVRRYLMRQRRWWRYFKDVVFRIVG